MAIPTEYGVFEAGAYNDVLRGGFDPYRAFVSLVPSLVDQTRIHRLESAYSYRDFLVGAGLYAFDSKRQRAAIFFDGNIKIAPEMPKYCAEQYVLDQAVHAKYDQAIGLVVAGTTDQSLIKEVTHNATDTLHPCEPCRNKYEKNNIVPNGMPVVTVGAEDDIYQVHTISELREAYDDSQSQAGTNDRFTHEIGFERWNKDRVLPYDRMVSLAESMDPAIAPTRTQIVNFALSSVLLAQPQANGFLNPSA